MHIFAGEQTFIAFALMQAQAEIGLMTDQLADSAQQLQQSHDLEAQLAQQLQAATANLQESQRQSAQAFSDCIVLRSQLDNTAAQLEQVTLFLRTLSMCPACISW